MTQPTPSTRLVYNCNPTPRSSCKLVGCVVGGIGNDVGNYAACDYTLDGGSKLVVRSRFAAMLLLMLLLPVLQCLKTLLFNHFSVLRGKRADAPFFTHPSQGLQISEDRPSL